MEIRLEDQIIHTEPHAIILYKIGTLQYFKSLEPFIHDWMHFTDPAPDLFGALQPDTLYYPRIHSFIAKTIEELESEFYGTQYGKDQLLQCKTEELFILLNRAVFDTSAPAVSKETEKILRYLKGTMFSSLETSWTVKKWQNWFI